MENKIYKRDGRFLKISNFRNIGLTNKNEIICLNRSSNFEYIGNLVILIGPNNVGKSNILDAINLLDENKLFTFKDLPSFLHSTKTEDSYIKYYVANNEDEYVKRYDQNFFDFISWKKNLVSKIQDLIRDNGNNNILFLWKTINDDYLDPKSFVDAINNATLKFLNKNNIESAKITYRTTKNNIYPYASNSIDKVLVYEQKENELNNILEKYKQACAANAELSITIPKVIKYEKWNINNLWFNTKYNETWNLLFTNIFNELGIRQEEIISGVNGRRRFYEEEIKIGIKRINEEFNNLFKVSGYLYEFELYFNDLSISLEINLVKNDDSEGPKIIPLLYEEQSTGFKYFFDLYFSLLIGQNKKMKPGDLILMDEPGSNLHVQGIIELRKILKNFCLKTGISIIISTHCPFFVDYDFLDELRIIDRVHGTVDINNNFQFNPSEKSSNSLKAVIKSLATYQNSLIKCSNPFFIFVEGITDYNYLTGFKYNLIQSSNDNEQIMKLNNIIFIPINGLGKNDEDFKCLENLIQHDFSEKKYKFLTDSDFNGSKFKTKYKEFAIEIKDLFKGAKEIECLISAEDKMNFNIAKDSNNSATFKLAIIKNKISNRTRENFNELFKNLLNIIY